MAMALGGKGGAISNINMTPMIDVLLVLIIIFMVITPLNKDKTYMINQEPTTEATLGPRLEEIFKTRAERVVFVKGDDDLEFQYVAKAIDIAHGAGIDKVGLMTPQMEAGN